MFKFFYNLRAIPRIHRDVLDHPDIAAMTPRELADLPLPRPEPAAKEGCGDG